MIIRNVEPRDLSSLLELENDAFDDHGLNAVTMRQQIDLFSDIFFVAEEKSELVGFIVGGVSVANSNGWILDAVVRREHRQKGIGTDLFHACINALKPLCNNKILLTVEPDSPAKFLYEKLGFIQADFDQNYFGKNSPRIIMELKWN